VTLVRSALLFLLVGLAVGDAWLLHARSTAAVALRSQHAAAHGSELNAHPAAPAPLSLGRFLVFPERPQHALNVLIAGVTPSYSGYHQQAPENFRGNTDSLLLVQLDPVTNAIRTLSLPRDTQVDFPGRGTHKLNAALPDLGPTGLVQTVETLTGLKLDSYLLVNLNGVRDLTDAVGGVDLSIPERMQYDDTAAKLHIDFEPGQQHLSGTQAEAYIRFRHDALGDIGRAQRQQAFVRALSKTLLTPAGLTHLGSYSAVMEQDTRSDISSSQVSGALWMALRRPQLETVLLPGSFLTQDGVSYWKTDPAQVASALKGFGSGLLRQEQSAVATPPTVALIGAGASPDTLAALQKRLIGQGYPDVRVSEKTVPQVATTEILSNSDAATAQTLQRVLGFGMARRSGEGVLWASLTVWVGRDAEQQGALRSAH
jgi:LCP family protein required for cell wall assembly